jgi:hypothetical protein
LLDDAGKVQAVKVCPGGAADMLELVREALGQIQETEDWAANFKAANSKVANSKVL